MTITNDQPQYYHILHRSRAVQTYRFDAGKSQLHSLRGNVVKQLLVDVLNPGHVNDFCVAQVHIKNINFIITSENSKSKKYTMFSC